MAVAAMLLVALIVAGSVAYLLRDPLPHFRERRSAIASAVPGPTSIEAGYALIPTRLLATSGLAVELVVRRAVADSGRQLPLAIILGGGQGSRLFPWTATR